MGTGHKPQADLKAELDHAQALVEVGGRYRHYKSEQMIYTVLCLAFQEENNQLCVVYRAEYGEGLTFIRPLDSWLMTVEWQGETMPRFTKI